jgi:hypothetical protein
MQPIENIQKRLHELYMQYDVFKQIERKTDFDKYNIEVLKINISILQWVLGIPQSF